MTGRVTVGGPIEQANGAKLRRAGKDLVIISWGSMIHEALAAAQTLAGQGHDVGVSICAGSRLSTTVPSQPQSMPVDVCSSSTKPIKPWASARRSWRV